MSFLYRTTPVLRTATRSSPRLFSTSVIQRKVVPDSVKEPLKKVDRAISDQLVKGLDVAEDAKEKTKEVAGQATGEAQKQAEGAKDQAQGKAQELKGKAERKM